ncbi:cupin domain-containing protein [Cocleimonas flava]|uniref:XRE family transcriptional regulator n=1 Tax=Cocleimonas flava TaxID=634765 RepID=A0A4R1EZ97_9GAMM|nr:MULTISPECIES: XRE family transcriptional regulator [Cocleimonas]MEB8431928.1 XRE family transcriptional regulator [Cocleimonas sp. KMM 6892]MEC4714986.1 XRE family transcriptional regulator [Cocleimonas sp. KMM 6895]MEC4744200.1 XRE family transcriptional regulator [Cocleimonas sp. KMM 6896]TCJ87207.1 XRE family transcriptional regulator [Cocleimonas flava]
MSKTFTDRLNETEAANAEANQGNLRLGQQIRDLRKSKGMTISYLAHQINKSVGYLSQVERGVSSLPIPVLQAISDTLEVQITWFFHTDTPQKEDEVDYIVRRNTRRHLEFSGTGVSEELLSPRLSGEIMMLQTTLEPGTVSDPEPRQRKGGEDAGVVLSGTLELTIDSKQFTLEEGDSFSIYDDKQHFYKNPSKTEKTVIIWVLTSQNY